MKSIVLTRYADRKIAELGLETRVSVDLVVDDDECVWLSDGAQVDAVCRTRAEIDAVLQAAAAAQKAE
jgi:hypothetical protein